jgi:hypothetical protein
LADHGKQQNQALNFGLDLKANDSNNIAITVGELKEMDRNMLNSKGSGAFENTGNSRTSFVKVDTSQNIVDHLNLTSTIAEGLTKVNGNDVDGTTGNWTIQEGAENLYIINNKTGKRFAFVLKELE